MSGVPGRGAASHAHQQEREGTPGLLSFSGQVIQSRGPQT